MSPSMLMFVALVTIVMGLALTSTIEIYTALLVLILSGLFFVMRDYFSPKMIYLLAILLCSFGISSQKDLTVPLYIIQLTLLIVVIAFCKFYVAAQILLNIVIAGMLLVAFVFLV